MHLLTCDTRRLTVPTCRAVCACQQPISIYFLINWTCAFGNQWSDVHDASLNTNSWYHPHFSTVHIIKLLLCAIYSFLASGDKMLSNSVYSVHDKVSEILRSQRYFSTIHVWMLIIQSPLNIRISLLFMLFSQLASHTLEYMEDFFGSNLQFSWKTNSNTLITLQYKIHFKSLYSLRDELQQFTTVPVQCWPANGSL